MKLLKKVLAGLTLALAIVAPTWATSDAVKNNPLEFKMVDRFKLPEDPQREAEFNKYIEKMHNAFSWIRNNNRHSAGNPVKWFGSSETFYYADPNKPISGGDTSFGYVLYYVYNAYCQMVNPDTSANCRSSNAFKVINGIQTRTINGGNVYAYYRLYKPGDHLYSSYSTSSTQSLMHLVERFWIDINGLLGESPYYEETLAYFQRRYVPIRINMLADANGDYHHMDDPKWLLAVNRQMNEYGDYYTGIHFRIVEVKKETVAKSNEYNTRFGKPLNELALNELLNVYYDLDGMRNRVLGHVSITATPFQHWRWGTAFQKYNTAHAMTFNYFLKYQPDEMYTDAVTRHAARVWLHEMGHNFNYTHEGPYHCDNYYSHVGSAGSYRYYLEKMNPKRRFYKL